MGGLLEKVSTKQRIKSLTSKGFFDGVILDRESNFTILVDWLSYVFNDWNGTINKFTDLWADGLVKHATPVKVSVVLNDYIGFTDNDGCLCYMIFNNSYVNGYSYTVSKSTKTEEIIRTYSLSRNGDIIPKEMVIRFFKVENKMPEYYLSYVYSQKEHTTTLTVGLPSYNVDIEYKRSTIDFDIYLAYKIYFIGFMPRHMFDLRPCIPRFLDVFKDSDLYPIRVTSYYRYMKLSKELSFSDILSCVEMTDTHMQYYMYSRIDYDKDIKESHGFSMSMPIEEFLRQTT